MDIRQAAREYLEKMEAHKNCCGVPLVRQMLSHIELHAGDCLSLDNEVTLMRDHWQEAEARVKELEPDRDRLLAACRRLVNDSMFKDHPEASQAAITAIAGRES